MWDALRRKCLPVVLLTTLAGCASSGAPGTASAPRNTGDNPDRFVFKISLDSVSNMLGSETVDDRARKIIERHRMNNAYNSYEIVRRTPVGGSNTDYEYEVQFAR